MSARGASQMIVAGALAPQLKIGLERFVAQRLLQRLFAKDASLWTANAADQQHIRNRLGWLSIVPVMEAKVSQIQAVAHEIQKAGFTHAILLGMGGSSLFSEVCRFTCGVAPGWLDLTVLDSTDPTAIETIRRRLPFERTIVIVSSKSGTTTEANALGDYFYEELRHTVGDQAGQRCVAITDAGTPLETLARQRKFRHVFVHGPTTGQDVGGRFSALTYFGLVPAALMGIDLRNLLACATEVLSQCQPTTPLPENPAAQLAVCLGEAASEGRDKVMVVCAKPLSRFGVWVEQLIAESTGKAGKGLVPIDGEPLRDVASYASDRLFIELQLDGQVDVELARKVDALAHAGHPVVRFRWHDAYDLGGEAMRWFVTTALAASVMQLNPFDEPNVQESKDRTKALLEKFVHEHKLTLTHPIMSDDQRALYGDRRLISGDTIEAALFTFLAQVQADGYIAILSFLPRDPALDSKLEWLRAFIAEEFKVATMLGYGPQYLHSIGQLHKGGPNQGVFLLLISEDPIDLPVPDKPYTFSVLKLAQALGDFQALRAHNRRILLFHTGQFPETALNRLGATLLAHRIFRGEQAK